MTKAAVVAAAFCAALLISGCGKKGAPSPPGPPSQVTWPRVYPTH
jgi:hypothetical protein